MIGTVSPTSVLLSWGPYMKTPYEGNIMNDCLADGCVTYALTYKLLMCTFPLLCIINMGPHLHIWRNLQKQKLQMDSCHHLEIELAVTGPSSVHIGHLRYTNLFYLGKVYLAQWPISQKKSLFFSPNGSLEPSCVFLWAQLVIIKHSTSKPEVYSWNVPPVLKCFNRF